MGLAPSPRSVVTLLWLSLAACGALNPRADGGTGGGAGGGSGGTGGGSDGGGSGGNGGGTAGGGGANGFSFATVTINSPGTGGIVGVSGTEQDLWALDFNGVVFHSTGSAFDRTSAQVGGQAVDLFAAEGRVFAVNVDTISTCLGACTAAGSYTTFPLDSLDHAQGMCGRSGNEAYVVAVDSANRGRLYTWNGSQWTAPTGTLPIDVATGCAVDAAGILFVSGRDGVVRIESGGATFEAISTDATLYRAVASVGGETDAVGGRYRIARRTGPGAWTIVEDPLAGVDLLAVGGPDAQTLFAAGMSGSAARHNWYQWDGATWHNAPADLIAFPSTSRIEAICPAGANTVYVGGTHNSAPVIVRASR